MSDAGAEIVGMERGRGGTSASALVTAVIAAAVAAFVLSWPYVFIMRWIPVFPLDVFFAGAFGWIIGRVVRAVVRLRKIASAGSATAVAVAAGVLAVWFAWLAHFFIVFGYEREVYTGLLSHPGALFELIAEMARHEVLSINGVKGVWLCWIAWIGELAVITGVAVLDVRSFAAANKLCPSCGDWLRDTEERALFGYPGDASVLEGIKNGDARLLLEQPRENEDSEGDEWLEAVGYACPACEGRNGFVRVFHGARRWNEKEKKHIIMRSALSDFFEVDIETEKKIFASPPAPPPSLPESEE